MATSRRTKHDDDPKPSLPASTSPTHRGVSGVVLDNTARWSELALGLTELVSGYSTRTLAETHGTPTPADDDGVGPADILRVLPGAAAALALRLQRQVFDQWARLETATNSAADLVGLQRLTDPMWRELHKLLSGLDEEFKSEQSARAEVAQEFLAAIGPQTLQELLSRVDLNALLADVDLDAVLERVDLDAVLDRVDLDRVADRIDIERLLERVDVNELAAAILADVEVTGLLRDGTGAIANSTVGVIRSQVEGVSKRLTRRPEQK